MIQAKHYYPQDPKKFNVLAIPAFLSYPHLDKPSSMTEGAEKTYSAQFLFSKEDKETVELIKATKKQVVAQALKEKWKNVAPAEDKMRVLKDGDQQEKHQDIYKGRFFFSAKNKNKPAIFLADTTKLTGEEEDFNELIYPGCNGYAIVRLYAYSNPAAKGIAWSLEGFQKYKDGVRFGGPVFNDMITNISDSDSNTESRLDDYASDIL